MNQKYGNLGGLPTTKQEDTATRCPLNCGTSSSIMNHAAVMTARPLPGTIATWWSRCQLCLTYWETSPAGEIIVLRRVLHLECCPDCRGLKSPGEPHVCVKEVA